jgi:pimeloyl-ACP methyl ester carboxylesterase
VYATLAGWSARRASNVHHPGMPEHRLIPRSDGGAIEVVLDGRPDGRVLLYHHGTPGSGLPSPEMVEAASARGLRYVAIARPGYAGSTRRPGRRVVDVADDAALVLDAIGASRCLTLGFSGGGPHALACAAAIPERVSAASTVGCIAPFDANGIDFLAGMGRENIEEFGAAVEGPAALHAFLGRYAETLRVVTGEQVADAFGDLVPAVDRAAIERGYATSLAATIRHGLEPGYLGWFDDDMAFVQDWGFALTEIRVPLALWQGEQDRMVPYAHGVWLSSVLPGVRAHLLPDHGHLSITVDSIGAVLDDLIAAAGAG